METRVGKPLTWQVLEEGTGRVEHIGEAVRLVLRPATDHTYCNAQIGDPRGHRRWSPPLRLSVRARFSHPFPGLRGTAGFGFWNTALSPRIKGIRPPQAVWYFLGAPPYNVPLAMGVPGHGFKAMVIDTCRPPFYALLPFAPFAIPLMRIPALYRRLWPIAQRAMAESEAVLSNLDLADWHAYTFHWQANRVTFAVDGSVVHETPAAPDTHLDFVAWIDNAYAVATPQGHFAMGKVHTEQTEWLELESLTIAEDR